MPNPPAGFVDHAASTLHYDHTGQQAAQRRHITAAIASLPRPEQCAFARLIYDGANPTTAAACLGQPPSIGAAWWLDVQDALGRKLRNAPRLPMWECELLEAIA